MTPRLAETVEHMRRNPHYQIRNRKNRIYEAGVGVKRKMSKLCPGRQTSVVAGDSMTDSSFVGSRSELAFSS